MTKRQWVYRPTEAEHEKLLEAMRENPEYPSVAQFIREGVLRLVYAEDQEILFTELSDCIDLTKDVLKVLLTKGKDDGN